MTPDGRTSQPRTRGKAPADEVILDGTAGVVSGEGGEELLPVCGSLRSTSTATLKELRTLPERDQDTPLCRS